MKPPQSITTVPLGHTDRRRSLSPRRKRSPLCIRGEQEPDNATTKTFTATNAVTTTTQRQLMPKQALRWQDSQHMRTDVNADVWEDDAEPSAFYQLVGLWEPLQLGDRAAF
jgi:hypothetical protein